MITTSTETPPRATRESGRPLKEYLRRYSLVNPARLVVRIAARQIRDRAARYLRGRMLDIGCGAKLKKLLVGDCVTEHIGLDREDCRHGQSEVDLFGSACAIPAEDRFFDSVLCTAVLEHLEDPETAIRESYRVLREGGHAVYTTPMIWHLHEEPRDFFRYTRYGLEQLFEAAGFEVLEITALSGFWVTFGSELCYYLQRFKRFPLTWVVNTLVAVILQLVWWLDRGLLRDERFTWAHLVVARRPARDPGSCDENQGENEHSANSDPAALGWR